jgi:hypothetical protein
MRLVNVHTGPLDNVKPGQTAEFDTDNPSVKQWVAARLLISEGELLASRAASLTNQPTLADVVALRTALADKDVIIRDLRDRAKEFDQFKERVTQGFGEQAERHDAEMRAAAQRAAALEEEAGRARDDLMTSVAHLTEARAKIAQLEADIATLTAPAGPDAGSASSAPAAGKPAAAPSARANRQG